VSAATAGIGQYFTLYNTPDARAPVSPIEPRTTSGRSSNAARDASAKTDSICELVLRKELWRRGLQKRKLVEEGFGWAKTIGGLRKLHHRGTEKVAWTLTFINAAYNLGR
jgi:hypothetical protein